MKRIILLLMISGLPLQSINIKLLANQKVQTYLLFKMVRLRSSSMPSKCTTFQLNFSNTHSLCITDSVSTGTNSFTVSFTVKKSSGNGKNLNNITCNNTSYSYKSFKCKSPTLGMCHPNNVGYIYITSATD